MGGTSIAASMTPVGMCVVGDQPHSRYDTGGESKVRPEQEPLTHDGCRLLIKLLIVNLFLLR